MSSQLPHLVEPQLLARRAAVVAGALPLQEMPRFLACLAGGTEAVVRLEISFQMTDEGAVSATGRILGEDVILVCQRCLEPMRLSLDIAVAWEFIATHGKARLGGEFEPVEVENGAIGLGDLVEDELLLWLPYSPMHSALCTATVDSRPAAAVRTRPLAFAGLAALKLHTVDEANVGPQN